MGRGNSDILFTPPVFKKPKKPVEVIEGSFPARSKNLIIGEHLTVFRGTDGTITLLSEEEPGKTLAKTRLTEKIDLWQKSIVYENEQSIIIQNDEGERIEKEGLPGQIVGFHLGDEKLYCLWYDEKWELYFSQTDLSDGAWEDLFLYPPNADGSLERKGDSSLFCSIHGETLSFSAIYPDGPSHLVNIQKNIPKDLIPSNKPYRLITPFGKKYIAVTKEGQAHQLSFLSPTGDRETIATLDPEQRYQEIVCSGGRGLLLSDRALILFDEKGIQKEIELKDSDYNRVTFAGERAIIWQEEYPDCQEFTLPLRQ